MPKGRKKTPQQASANGAGRRRRRRPQTQSIAAANACNPMPQNPRRRGRRRGINLKMGDVRIRRRELYVPLTGATDKEVICQKFIKPDDIPWLKVLSASFQRFRFERVALSWRPAVGTTFAGMVTYGVQWDCGTAPDTRAKVQTYTPAMDHPIWQSTDARPMVLPPSQLHSRQWFATSGSTDPIDKAPAAISIAASKVEKAILLGELWIEYDVILEGPKS